MEKKSDIIDNLFDLIDNELIILSEAKAKGSYEWFDFVAALQLLNDNLQNEGYNEYRTRKVSRLVNVFNDLCHTIVQSYSCRILSYDKERKIVTEEWNIFGKENRIETIEHGVHRELEEYYESLHLPKQIYSGDIHKVTKIAYLLRDCKEECTNLASIYFPESVKNESLLNANWNMWALKHFLLLDSQRKDFNSIFAIDSNIIYNHRITFEEYVKDLKIKWNILEKSMKIDSPIILKSAHFAVAKSYEEMQRILTALQQHRFISTNTKIEEFYYRMTGNGEPVQGRICWVKKAKNKAISLTSLIDFLVTIGVELESALSQVDDVFCREDGSNIKLPNDTKTTARKKRAHGQDLSEYHQTIMAIIDDGQTTKYNS